MKKNTATLRKSPSGKWNFTLQGYESKGEAKRIVKKYFPYFEIIEA